MLAAALLALALFPAQTDSTLRADAVRADAVRTEFAALCEQIRASDDPYFGEAQIRDLQARLERPISSLQAQIGTRARLAGELRRLGRLDESISLFNEALRLLGETPAPALRRQLVRDLALAHLLRAEDDNCVEHHGAASCRLPIAPEAVHQNAEHTRRAAELYGRLSATDPADPAARWLHSLSRALAGDGDGPLDETSSDDTFPQWTDVAPQLGVASYDLAGGAVMDDFDGDGLLDLISSTWDPCDSLKAFRNLGDGRFEDVTVRWGLDAQLGGLNLVHADYDGDGMLDLLVLRGAWRGARGEVRESLLRNALAEEASRFVDVSREVGLTARRPTQTAAWADYDGDGDLDLYVGHEGDAQNDYPSALYRNEGGRFVDVAETAGVANRRFAKGVAWGDYDDDGDPDLFVANLGFGPEGVDRLYRNEGGRFIDVAEDVGLKGPESSFATWFFDHDDDGDLDLFVADYGALYSTVFASYLDFSMYGRRGGHPRLYLNDGGRFVDASAAVGLTRPLLPMGSGWEDLDGDGRADFYLGTGVPDLEAVMPNVMYRGVPGGFVDITSTGGFGHLQKGHGVAFGDLDRDGDVDLFQQMGGAYPVDAFFNALYENPDQSEDWIVLGGLPIGTRIRVDVGDQELFRTIGAQGSFSGSSLQAEIGFAGSPSAPVRVEIRSPSGKVQILRGIRPDRYYRNP